MARIAYILLCHKDPEGIIAQAERLTAAGDYIAIHFDGRAANADFAAIRTALAGNRSVTFARRRHRCGWGEWSLVAATLEALRAATTAFPRATHFFMLSGDCMPIKTAEYAHAFLDREEADYIESFDFFTSDWIKTGIKAERLIYRHYFNERSQKQLFYAAMDWQRKLGLTRRIPADLTIQIGSQWWCLRRRTVEAVLAFIARRRDVLRFFRTTWIPDETFFQTLVRHLVPEHEIRTRPLTFLMFSDYGMPVTFYNDQHDLLLAQDYLFARKISADAVELKARLGALYTATGVTFQISGEGRALFQFLVGRGRIGRRFAPRFWEIETSLGRNRTLLLLTCKKWKVAKHLAARIRAHSDVPTMDYVFNEEDAPLPDLGGIQTTLEKRTRHRRALVRMLFDYWQSDRLLLCIDPGSIDLMQDFYNDRLTVRLIEVECEFSDEYLLGHARRIGLSSPVSPRESVEKLLPTLRYELRYESDRIRDADFANFHRLRQSASLAENAATLAAFLGVTEAEALAILATDTLFLD